MKRVISLILASILMLGLAACHKTPGNSIVMGKGDVTLEKAIEQNSTQTLLKYNAPECWTDSFKENNLLIMVDAEIIVPDVSEFSIGILATDEISQETADKIMAVLFRGATLYTQRPDFPYTKEEIMGIILTIKQDMSDPDSGYSEAALIELQKDLEALEKAYKTAPETFVPEPADTRFNRVYHPELAAPTAIEDDMPEELRKGAEEANRALREAGQESFYLEEINGTAVLDNGITAHINFAKRQVYFYTNVVEGHALLPGEMWWVDVPECEAGIAERQARETAVQAIKDMGLGYLDITECGVRYILDRGADGRFKAKRLCYSFTFSRSIGGITENLADPKYMPEKPPQYVQPASHEMAEVVVAKEGVVTFLWVQPTMLVDMMADNVSLLAFEDVQDVFKRHIIIKYADFDSDYKYHTNYRYDSLPILERRIIIETAKLGLMRVMRQGKEGEYLMIPVWDFYGYDTIAFENSNAAKEMQIRLNENDELVDAAPYRSYLTINAIDGSVIDRYAGY